MALWVSDGIPRLTSSRPRSCLDFRSFPQARKPAWIRDPAPCGFPRLGSRPRSEAGHPSEGTVCVLCWALCLQPPSGIIWRRKWQPTPVFLPGESQGRGSLVGYRLWGCRVGHDGRTDTMRLKQSLRWSRSCRNIQKPRTCIFLYLCGFKTLVLRILAFCTTLLLL